MKFEAELGGETVAIEVTGTAGHYRVVVGDEAVEVDARPAAEGIWSLLIGTVSHVVDVSDRDGGCIVEVDGETYHIRVEEETRYIIRTRGGKGEATGQVLKAPMPGKVVHIEVEVGQAGQARRRARGAGGDEDGERVPGGGGGPRPGNPGGSRPRRQPRGYPRGDRVARRRRI